MPTPNPMIAHTVLWYPRADKGAHPRAAIVTGPGETHRDNVLSLTVFGENTVVPTTFSGVRHVDDPKLETHPRMREVGGWDSIAAVALKPVPQPVPQPVPPKEQTRKQGKP